MKRVCVPVRKQNDKQSPDSTNPKHHWLLPMAFPEGSPMHPAYGAGHATVAGACVSMLKAFFDMGGQHRSHKKMLVERDGIAWVPTPGESAGDMNTKLVGVPIPEGLTIEGELNKLAWNISNARSIAGVRLSSQSETLNLKHSSMRRAHISSQQ